MKKKTVPDTIPVRFFCRICWVRSYFEMSAYSLEGRTMDEIKKIIDYRHSKQCPNTDIRLAPIPGRKKK